MLLTVENIIRDVL
uniref:Uncharacterized protein n=1 Tax=Rhizophora mucronata TaxID=61149 RepID=A0A2P2Q9Q1_RHIMU